MAPEKLILTYQDYSRMPDDRTRKEILGGDLYVTPAPTPAHQRVVAELVAILRTHAKRHGVGEIFVSPLDVVLSQTDVVQPDVVFVAEANKPIIGEAAVLGPPDLVIEVRAQDGPLRAVGGCGVLDRRSRQPLGGSLQA